MYNKSLNEHFMTKNIICPESNKKEQWIEAMKVMVKKNFMLQEEFNQCLELGCMPGKILEKIKIRIDLITVHFICN